MRICLLGKYPPIQGGVSARSYWTARWLAARGHEVHVVTNADEVEPGFRIRPLPGDEAWTGEVRVWSTSPPGPAMRHIPDHNPFVTKLTSLAVTAVEEVGADVIVSFYFEPYAVAGFLAASFTGVPLVTRHAGSDVGRLLRHPQLGPCYERVLRKAALVCGSPVSLEHFAGLGVSRDRLQLDPGFALPVEVFHPGAPATHLRPGVPTFGIYGKVGPVKGSFDLVAALGRLAAAGRDFRFLALAGGAPEQVGLFHEAIRAAGIEERTDVVPFLAHWRVPGFLRSLTAACFLERDFPIDHNPGIPQEVLAVGVPLVTTVEVARKQPFAPRLVDGVNCVLVNDPRDTDELVAALDRLITDPEGAAGIGARGYASLPVPNVERFMARYEAMLERAVGPARHTTVPKWEPFAASRRVLGPATKRIEAAVGVHADPADHALALCDAFADHWLAEAGSLPPYTGELLRWELHRVTAPARAGVTDALLFRRMVSVASPVVLTLAHNVDVRLFPYDMEALYEAVVAGEAPPAHWRESPSSYVFQHLPGHPWTRVIRIGVEVYDLLATVEGGTQLSGLAAQATAALSSLMQEGVVVVTQGEERFDGDEAP